VSIRPKILIENAYGFRHAGGPYGRGFVFSDSFLYQAGQLGTVDGGRWLTTNTDYVTNNDFVDAVGPPSFGVVYDPASINQPTYTRIPASKGWPVGHINFDAPYELLLTVQFSSLAVGAIQASIIWLGDPAGAGANKYGFTCGISGAAGFASMGAADANGGVIFTNNPDIGLGAGVLPLNVPHIIAVKWTGSSLRFLLDNVLQFTSPTKPANNGGNYIGFSIGDPTQRVKIIKWACSGSLK
jgi:hypothetical protein